MTKRDDAGFTLVEVLVVTAIIGVLAAIAIPAYAGYKSNGIDAQMFSTLRTARTAAEAYYAKNGQTYEGLTLAWMEGPDGDFRQTDGVGFAIVEAEIDSFKLRACAPGGTSPAFVVDSNGGAAVADSGSCS